MGITADRCPSSVDELEEHLSRPTDRVVDVLGSLNGDILFLGIGGKMGPTMARMARRALDIAGRRRRVIGVSRFSTPGLRERLDQWGIETHSCNLLETKELARLPDAPLVVSMSGFKFGATSNPGMAWAMNCYLPALVAERFAGSRIVAFSSGNVYGMVPVSSGGSIESDELRPEGEYAMTAMGRERMYSYACQRWECPLALLRLNYATELRYGVLVDLARQVLDGKAIDVSMPFVNVIWLRDANAMSLAAFAHTGLPPIILNVAGSEILRVRDVCGDFARLMNLDVTFTGQEGAQALLNNGHRAYEKLGHPEHDRSQMVSWTAEWVARGGESLDKPTHFQVRDGRF